MAGLLLLLPWLLMVLQNGAPSGICHSLSTIFERKKKRMCLTHFRIDYQLQTYIRNAHPAMAMDAASGEVNKWPRIAPVFLLFWRWLEWPLAHTLAHNVIFDGGVAQSIFFTRHVILFSPVEYSFEWFAPTPPPIHECLGKYYES